jgi:hypothetical protein
VVVPFCVNPVTDEEEGYAFQVNVVPGTVGKRVMGDDEEPEQID